MDTNKLFDIYRTLGLKLNDKDTISDKLKVIKFNINYTNRDNINALMLCDDLNIARYLVNNGINLYHLDNDLEDVLSYELSDDVRMYLNITMFSKYHDIWKYFPDKRVKPYTMSEILAKRKVQYTKKQNFDIMAVYKKITPYLDTMVPILSNVAIAIPILSKLIQ